MPQPTSTTLRAETSPRISGTKRSAEFEEPARCDEKNSGLYEDSTKASPREVGAASKWTRGKNIQRSLGDDRDSPERDLRPPASL